MAHASGPSLWTKGKHDTVSGKLYAEKKRHKTALFLPRQKGCLPSLPPVCRTLRSCARGKRKLHFKTRAEGDIWLGTRERRAGAVRRHAERFLFPSWPQLHLCTMASIFLHPLIPPSTPGSEDKMDKGQSCQKLPHVTIQLECGALCPDFPERKLTIWRKELFSHKASRQYDKVIAYGNFLLFLSFVTGPLTGGDAEPPTPPEPLGASLPCLSSSLCCLRRDTLGHLSKARQCPYVMSFFS